MKTTKFKYHDYDYSTAVNYDGTNYYNPPMTVTIDGIKYILGTGSSDRINHEERNNFVYIVSENWGLNYISLTEINTDDKTVSSCFLSDNDLTDPDCMSFDLLNKDTEEQINVLCEYLPY